MMTHRLTPRQLAHSWVEAFNTGDEGLIWRLFNTRVVNHTSFLPHLSGVDSMVGEVASYRAAFGALETTAHDIIATDEMAACRWSATGRHEGIFLGVQPTGKEVRTSGIFLVKTRNGEITDHWVYLDLPGMLQQLGAMPPMGQPAAFGDQTAPPRVQTDEVTRQRNMQLTRTLFDVSLNGDLAVIADLLSPHGVDHNPLLPDQAPGIPGVQQVFAHLTGTLSNRRLSVDTLFAEDDRVLIATTISGTHSGNFMGIPPTQRPLSLKGLHLFRFDTNSLMTDRWGEGNNLELLMQMGVIPPMSEDDGIAV